MGSAQRCLGENAADMKVDNRKRWTDDERSAILMEELFQKVRNTVHEAQRKKYLLEYLF